MINELWMEKLENSPKNTTTIRNGNELKIHDEREDKKIEEFYN